MAFVGDDEVKGVNGDVELVGVFIARSEFTKDSGGGLPSEMFIAMRWIVQT